MLQDKNISHDSETLAVGLQVFTACAFIHKEIEGEQKVLVTKRALTKKFLPGVYELPGGHIDFGEDLKEGLKREIKEELNVEIEVGDPFYVFTYLNEIKKSHSIEVIYFSKLASDVSQITINLEDHMEYLWISEDQIPKIYTPGKKEEDEEIMAIRKGFSILKGEKLNYL